MVRILTVDDSRSMRQMVSYTLKSAGFEVIEKEDGKQAYDWALENSDVDLVLSDVNMPNMDGLQLVQLLRKLPAYQFLPIIMLTTESSPEKKAEGKKAGATGWIVKPFSPDQLITTLKKVISMSGK